MPATCTQCTAPATHDFRPPSSAQNREPDFEPRCDAHGLSRRPTPPRRLSGVVLGLLVALVRRLSSICTAEGISLTVTLTPTGAAVRFDGDVVPSHIAARPGPDGWQYLDIELDPHVLGLGPGEVAGGLVQVDRGVAERVGDRSERPVRLGHLPRRPRGVGVSYIALRQVKLSHKAMAAAGWTRTDPKPWSKCSARWSHRDGWKLTHCGHPTAHYSWILRNPAGAYVLTGATVSGNPTFGTHWPNLAMAVDLVSRKGPAFAAWTPPVSS